MKNKNIKDYEMIEVQNSMAEAIRNGDEKSFMEAQTKMADIIQNRILEKAKEFVGKEVTSRVRVVGDVLTAEEREYYNEVIEVGGFDSVDKLVPPTVMERVFDGLKQEHALLDEIDFINATGLTELTFRDETKDGQTAAWGAITSAITKQLEAGFKVAKVGSNSLTAFIPVHQSMLALGPVWLDRYVVEVLKESLAIGLETAVVAGTGKTMPIGMIKDLDGNVVAGEYPDKTGTELTTLAPKSLGENIMAPLTKGGKRAVNNVLIVVNPLDYWGKIFASTTFLTADKTYVHGVLPIPAKIIQSAAVPTNRMVAGIGKDYFATISGSGKIEASDHCKFLEDQRVYKAKLLADGYPKDNASFLVFDITNLVPEA